MADDIANVYTPVFDIADVGYRGLPGVAFGLVFVAIGALWFVFPDLYPRRGPKWIGDSFRQVFLGFSVLWTVIAFGGSYMEYRSASSAIAQNRANRVEGLVRDFQPMPYAGHVNEHFCVSDKCFDYSDYSVTAGFNNTASHGGPIREALPVRITYIDNTILRLEIAKTAP